MKRGDVVGERTFGEGSVQKTIDLADGAAILLTVAKYQDPDGKKIEDEAVTPNEVVSTPEEDNELSPQPNGDEPLQSRAGAAESKERITCGFPAVAISAKTLLIVLLIPFPPLGSVSRSCIAWFKTGPSWPPWIDLMLA